MADRVLIPLPGIGTLLLGREAFEAGLSAGTGVSVASGAFPVPKDEPLMDSEQLSAALGVPVSWLELAARQGRIPSLEFGRWRRFKRAEVEAAVRVQRAGKT